MLFQCWASVENDGPTLKQHRVNLPCFLGRPGIEMSYPNIVLILSRRPQHRVCLCGIFRFRFWNQLDVLVFSRYY